MFGGVVSTTVIVWLHTLLLPQVSLALQVRTMLVRPGQRGLTAVLTVFRMRITTLVPSQASTAKGGVKANAVPHSTTWLFPQVTLGGSVSINVIVWLHT